VIPFFAARRELAAHGEHWMALAAEALADGRPLQGEAVGAFEAELAEACGRRHAVAVGSGTDALFFALTTLGVGPGDEVLVPALSFVASATCVVRAGATPVFADVDERLLLDLDAARHAVGPRTRAVLAVELYGQMLDPHALEAFAARHGLALVEDAAQAPGARAAGRPAGSVGAISCLSFDPTKTLSAPGSGGAALTDDDALATRLRRLRWHGRGEDGRIAELGYNSQLPTAAAAVLRDKLRRDAAWSERRRAIAAAYDAALPGLPEAPGTVHARSKYVARVHDRDALRTRLERAGVPTAVHYPVPLHREPLLAERGRSTPCPRAEQAAREVVSLPIHAFLTDAEVEQVLAAIRA